MGTPQYFAGNSPEEIEEQRLGFLESGCDTATTERIEKLGIDRGWRCLEVGAGRGSVARWLAHRVGPTGHVVAADLDLRFLQRIALPNFDVRQHDICEKDFEAGAYDLVHCRALLVHVAKPEEALGRLAEAVRPGGWLLVEEPDYGSFGCVDPSYPGALEFHQSARTMWEFSHAAGRLHSYFARRLPGLVERLGFQSVGFDAAASLGHGCDSLAGFYSLSFKVAAERLIARRVRTAEQLDHLQRMLNDPSFEFLGPIFFTVWARRP